MLEEYTEKEHDKVNSIIDKIKNQQSIIERANNQIEQIKNQLKNDIPKGAWIKIKKRGTTTYVQIYYLDITKNYKVKIFFTKSILVREQSSIMMYNNGNENSIILELDKIISISEEEIIKELNTIHFKKFFSC